MSKIKMIGLLDIKGNECVRRVYDRSGISPTLTTSAGGNRQPKIIVGGDEMIIDDKQIFREGKPRIYPDVSCTVNARDYKGPLMTLGGESLKKVTVNDLFCGSGGMGLGFKQSGFEITGAWDFDKYAVESYKHNVGDHVLQADITQMTADDLPIADVWTFGFPCQDISIAGNKQGMIKGETRSGLFYEVMRLVGEVEEKPKIILAENVKALKSLLPVLEEEYKAAGYKMYYTLYNSKFWGVPQNRERYFVVGVHESIEKEFEFPIQQDKYVPRLSTVLESEVDEKYYINGEKSAKIIEMAKEKNLGKPKAVQNGCIDESLRVRKLTPREYARLQGFPESFEIVVSNSQAYKQFGNAVTVNVARSIAERIRIFLLSL